MYNSAVTLANPQKFEVTEAKKTNKWKMFLHFYNFEYLIRRNPPQFSMVWSGLEKYHLRKNEYFWPIKKKRLTGVLK